MRSSVRRITASVGTFGALATLPFTSLAVAAVVVAAAPAASAASAPATRAYELVSPIDKNGGDVDRNDLERDYVTSGASASGDAIGYASQAVFADAQSGPPHVQYRSRRGMVGWATQALSPPLQPKGEGTFNTPRVHYLSEDLSKAVVTTAVPLTSGAAALGGSWGLYLQDKGGTPEYTLISVPATALPEDPDSTLAAQRFRFVAATPDMTHVVFSGNGRPLTAEAPATGRSVYEWVNGTVRLVSVLPDGGLPNNADGGARNVGFQQSYPGDHVISDDGNRIFFSGLGVGKGLYVREGGTATRAVSTSERTGDDPNAPASAVFEAAKASDGSQALFQAIPPLTDDSEGAGNLYLWHADAPAGERLTNLTPGDPAGGGVLGLAAATPDLSSVYFVGTGALADDAQPGEPNLYLWRPGHELRLVATLDSTPLSGQPRDTPVWSIERDQVDRRYRDARASADGSRLLFTSYEQLDDFDTAGRKQVYLYDANTDDVICVSCSRISTSSSANADLFPIVESETAGGITVPYRLPRNLSADGRRVFFETTERLLASDRNGGADVYIWEDGDLSLLSSGSSGYEALFIDASVSGDDVFFTTRERLVPSDQDDQVDVYDARVGGGFPGSDVLLPCAGDACQGPQSARPTPLPIGSATFHGKGNVSARRPAELAVRRPSARSRRRFARTGVLPLIVRVSRPGRVRAVASAQIRRRTRRVMSSSKRAKHAGKVKLRLRLAKTGRHRLRHRRRARIDVTVRLRGALEPQRISMVLNLPRHGRGAGGR